MAFKQPRVPEYRESEGTGKYIRSLVLFLTDFCMDVWTANNQRSGEIDAVKGGLSGIHYPVTSVCGKTGDVTLTAGDVGALAQGGTAADSSKLGGRTWDEHLLEIYPIGSIYMSAGSASPASLFGGTWERLKDRFLLGAGDSYAAGGTGGETTHNLTIDEMPSHRHVINASYSSAGSSSSDGGKILSGDDNNAWLWDFTSTNWVGGSAAHNNMPPYLAVYMWKRVS